MSRESISFFAMQARDMKLLSLSNDCTAVDKKETLEIIKQYTSGSFYLSDYSVGFENVDDLIMFNLAYRK